MFLWSLVEQKAKKLYGDPLPKEVGTQLDREWAQIRQLRHEAKWVGTWKLMRLCRGVDDLAVQAYDRFDYYLSAFLLGITQINPLPPHYICPHCQSLQFADDAPTQGELWWKTCSCGAERYTLGYNLPFGMLEAYPWTPAIQVSTSHLELVQQWNEALPTAEQIRITGNSRLEMLHQMLRRSGECFWDIPEYDRDMLQMFASPFPNDFEPDDCLGIDEIASSHEMLKLVQLVNCTTMNELIKLSGCAVHPAKYTARELRRCQAGAAFEDIPTCADDLYLKREGDEWMEESFCKMLCAKSRCVSTALLALKFAYMKLSAPEVFFAVTVEYMNPKNWGAEHGDMYLTVVDAWSRANAMLGIEAPEPDPSQVSFELLANYLHQNEEASGRPFFGRDLLLLTEIAMSPFANNVWEMIDPLLF